MHQAFRYELHPNRQRTHLAKHAGCARFAYNRGLARRRDAYAASGMSLGAVEFPGIKEGDFPWMYEVSKWAPQGALCDLDRAFTNFFAKGSRFPRFKKKGVCRDSFRLTGAIHVLTGAVALPRLGRIRTKEATAKFKGRILSATISKEAGRWFVSIAVEVERATSTPRSAGLVGIDLGLTSFVVLSDGTEIQASRPLRAELRRLRHAQRALSQKEKGSRRRRQCARHLGRLHRRIRNQRCDFLHKTTSRLAREYGVVAVEDLAVSNLIRNRKLPSRPSPTAGGRSSGGCWSTNAKGGGQAAGRGQVFPVQQDLCGLRCDPGGVDA